MAVTYAAASPQKFDLFWQVEQRAHQYPWSESNLYGCLMSPYWGELMQFDGKAVGFYLFQQVLDEVTLVNVCIDPNQQGQGLGKQLMQRAIQQAKLHNAAICYLEVRAGNQAALGLYDKVGFNNDGVRKGYYPKGKGREDAVLMSLKLD